MNQPLDPSSFPAEELGNPNIDPATLAALAQQRPDLWGGILQHPQCYPGLAEWIQQRQAESQQPGQNGPSAWGQQVSDGAGSAAAQSAAQPAAQSAAQPAAQSAAQPAAQQPQDGQPGGGQQFLQGAKQAGQGAKQVGVGAARSFQRAVGEQTRESGLSKIMGWIPLALAVLGLLAIGSLFLPMTKIDLPSDELIEGKIKPLFVGFYGAGRGHIGIYLVILLGLMVVASVAAFVLKKFWARLAAAALGLASGILGLVAGFGAGLGSSEKYKHQIKDYATDFIFNKMKKHQDFFDEYSSGDLKELREDVADDVQDELSDGVYWDEFSNHMAAGAIILGILSILLVIVAIVVVVPPKKLESLGAGIAAGQAPQGSAAQPYGGGQYQGQQAWPTQGQQAQQGQQAWPGQQPQPGQQAWPGQQGQPEQRNWPTEQGEPSAWTQNAPSPTDPNGVQGQQNPASE